MTTQATGQDFDLVEVRNFSDICGFHNAQWKATDIADGVPFFLFGGPRGPGKSYWLRWYLMRFLLRVYAELGLQNVRVMLASETWPTLYDRHIIRIQTEFPKWLGTYYKQAREFVLHPGYGSGVLALRNLDDPDKYAGAEFAVIAVDELTRQKFKTFDTLVGSLRWPDLPDEWHKFIAASMTTGIGRKWVRKLWVEKKVPDEFEGDEPDFGTLDDYRLFSAQTSDNPHLSAGYRRFLKTRSAPLRKAWLGGDWYVTFEGLVYESFNQDNVLDGEWLPEIDEDGDPVLEVEMAFDDGYQDPRAILFLQRSGSHIFIFDELYERQQLTDEAVDRVYERMVTHFGATQDDDGDQVEDEFGRVVPKVLPAMAIGSPEAKELQRRFRAANIPVRKPGFKDVVEGINLVRRLIEDGQGHRTILIHPRCANLISEITEGYIYPEEGTRKDEERPVDGNDHACDGLRYWCSARARRL